IGDELGEKVRFRHCASVEFRARHPEHERHVTVSATIAAAAIWIRGQRRIFAGLPLGCVNDPATLHAAIGIEGHVSFPLPCTAARKASITRALFVIPMMRFSNKDSGRAGMGHTPSSPWSMHLR